MDKCKHGFDHACLICGFTHIDGKKVWFDWAWQEQQKQIDELQARVDELTVGCGLQRDHIRGLEAELKKAWTTVDQEGHKNHELVMLLKFIKEHFEMNDLDKAMPRVYEELEQALKGDKS